MNDTYLTERGYKEYESTPFDNENIVAYLETNKEGNVSLYKHFGFELSKNEMIPKSSVMHYAMVRNPDIKK